MPLGWWSYGTVRCTYCEKNSNSSLFLTELVQNNAWALRSCPDFALQSPRYLSKLISYIQQIWLFPGLLAGNPTWPLCSGTNFPLFTLPTVEVTSCSKVQPLLQCLCTFLSDCRSGNLALLLGRSTATAAAPEPAHPHFEKFDSVGL